MPLTDTTTIANIVSRLGEDSFPTDIITFLREAVYFDSSIILAYPGDGKLQIVYDALVEKDRAVFDTTYREGLWSMSPLYLNACSGFRGPFHIREQAPKNFEQSTFFKRYWSQSGIFDQFAYIAQLPDGTPLVISLERSKALSSYTVEEIRKLKASADLITALLEKHWQHGVNLERSSSRSVHKGREKLLHVFSDAKLTPRESAVLEYLVLGLSNKMIGRELGISDQTVKVYCKNINAKLGLSGRSEIYAKVVKSILHDGDNL